MPGGHNLWLARQFRQTRIETRSRIGPPGFEPRLTDPKSAVLPLDEGPPQQLTNRTPQFVLVLSVSGPSVPPARGSAAADAPASGGCTRPSGSRWSRAPGSAESFSSRTRHGTSPWPPCGGSRATGSRATRAARASVANGTCRPRSSATAPRAHRRTRTRSASPRAPSKSTSDHVRPSASPSRTPVPRSTCQRAASRLLPVAGFAASTLRSTASPSAIRRIVRAWDDDGRASESPEGCLVPDKSTPVARTAHCLPLAKPRSLSLGKTPHSQVGGRSSHPACLVATMGDRYVCLSLDRVS